MSLSGFVQVCHIVLGLRPATPEEEGQIIRYINVFIIDPSSMHNIEEYGNDLCPLDLCFSVCVCMCVGV